MNVDLSQYIGPCSCGESHGLLTREIIVEPGAVRRLGEVTSRLQLTGKGCIVCDENTKPYALQAQENLPGALHASSPLAVLDPRDLHADERAVALLQQALPQDAGWLLAVGSGTIHDATRYVANDRGIHFLSFPTAASVDGFVSTVSAMTWYGFKKTLPGVAPLAVVADSDIFSKAPYRLTAAGIGDVLGKYTSLFDWKVTNMVAGMPYCSRIAELAKEAADNVMDCLDGIAARDVQSCEKLMFALLLSGLAMQMWGDSHPASGAEHHLSHLWEMGVINEHVDAYHGEKVGVGLLIALEVYGRLAAIPQEQLKVIDYKGLPVELLREKFGEALIDAVIEENTPDLTEQVDRKALIEKFPEIRRMIGELPDAGEMRRKMRDARCPVTMEEIGLDSALKEESILMAPFARGRLTLLRISKILDS